MSNNDYFRYLRAVNGGISFLEVSEATGVPGSFLRQLEQRYRPMYDEDALHKLAAFYGVPWAEVTWRQPWSRRALTFFLRKVVETGALSQFELASGETFVGTVRWFDLGALLLAREDGTEVVVQRHTVERWSLAGEPFTPPAEETV